MKNFCSHIHRQPIAAFIILSCIWSWSYWELIVRPLGMTEERWMQIPFAWGPLIAALLVTRLTHEHGRGLSGRLLKWRIRIHWYLLALLLPFVDVFVLLAMSLFGTPVTLAERPAGEYLSRFFTTLLIAGALEEFGWRGFLQPRLQQKYSALTSAIVVGLIWALWHFPVVYFGGASYESGDFFGFLIILPLWSIVMAWMYNSTDGALLIPMLFHASTNTPDPLRISDTATQTAQMSFELIILAFWVLLPISLVIYNGKKYLALHKPNSFSGGIEK